MKKILYFSIINFSILSGCTMAPQRSIYPPRQEVSNQQEQITIPPNKQNKQIPKKTSLTNSRYYRYKMKQKCLKEGYKTKTELNLCIKRLTDSNE